MNVEDDNPPPATIRPGETTPVVDFPPPAQLVPHAGPAILIDRIVEDTAAHAVASATITAAHPYFVAGHGVPAWIGIELMAQVIAAHAALDGGNGDDAAPRRGMLLGTRRYHARVAWFAEGTQLAIRAERAFGHGGGMAACDCRIEADGRVLAEATIIILEETDT